MDRIARLPKMVGARPLLPDFASDSPPADRAVAVAGVVVAAAHIVAAVGALSVATWRGLPRHGL